MRNLQQYQKKIYNKYYTENNHQKPNKILQRSIRKEINSIKNIKYGWYSNNKFFIFQKMFSRMKVMLKNMD